MFRPRIRQPLVAGIVSLLDSRTARRVVEIRRRLETDLGVRTPIRNHFPHVSYQVARRYDDAVTEAVRELAAVQEPFSVTTNGIGVFSDSDPLIVYIPVVRDARLSAFHSEVWTTGTAVGEGFQEYYRPDRWTPHVTLAPVDRDEVSAVMELLSGYSFRWDVRIDNVAIIRGDAPNRTVEHHTPLADVDSCAEPADRT